MGGGVSSAWLGGAVSWLCWFVGGGVGFAPSRWLAPAVFPLPAARWVALLAGGVPSVALWGFRVPRLFGCWLPGCLSPFLAVCFFPFVYVFIVPYFRGTDKVFFLVFFRSVPLLVG